MEFKNPASPPKRIPEWRPSVVSVFSSRYSNFKSCIRGCQHNILYQQKLGAALIPYFVTKVQ